MSVHEIRTAAADYTCCDCGVTIPKGAKHLRTRGRFKGARTSVRSHIACPRVRIATVQMQPIITAMPAHVVPSPIPTRPVPKHERKPGWGRREGGAPLTVAAILVLVGLMALALLLASYWRGQ